MAATFRLRSPQNGTEYHISVDAPAAACERAPWPVMLFLDGDDQFKFAVAAYRELRAKEQVPPLLLAGVGYGASYQDPANRRGRDYTPTASTDEPGSGGADAFHSFLADTLWPELRRRWPLRDDARGIGGHSVGSLFVLHALFQRQPFFHRHLVSAPAIWWDNRAILCHARRVRETQTDLRARLFLSIGGQDTASMQLELDMLSEQLAAASFAGLVVTREDFPARTHYDVLPDSFRAGLRALFGGD